MYANESKNFKVTIIGELGDYKNPDWCKLADLEGNYAKYVLKVNGFFTKHNDYADEYAKGLDKVNIFLILTNTETDKNYFVKVPHGLGVKIVEDRDAFDGDIEEYLDGASIKSIRSFKTKYGSKSANYTLW